MKTYITDIIPKIQRFSHRLDELTLLTNQHWIAVDEIEQSKKVYIFRSNNDLLISKNGIIEKGKWEYLGNQSLMLETSSGVFLLKHGFFDSKILALKLDSTDAYTFFVNEMKFHKELNNINDLWLFLEHEYLNKEKVLQQETSSFEYDILDYWPEKNILWGRYLNYKIQCKEKIGNVYKGINTGKYFYVDFIKGKVYCNTLDEAVAENFRK